MKMLNIIILIIFLNETFAYLFDPSSDIKPTIKGVYWGYDCPGNDLFTFRTYSWSCMDSCRRTPDCTHVVWSQTKNQTCYLKKGLFAQQNLKKTNDSEIMNTMCAELSDKVTPKQVLQEFNNTVEYKWDCR
jgi:hypothetical protein